MHVGGENISIAGDRLPDCLLDILESLLGLIKQESHEACVSAVAVRCELARDVAY
jgi:hypothetical protein